jgi:DNA-directed RNA polymerase specialized sigma24 family protein
VRAALKAELPVDGSAMTEMTDTANSLPAPEESVLLAERHRDVWRAVRTLPRRCQELLRVVAFVNRPDYDEIAVALGMPRGSIGPTRGRCLAKLRTLLDTEPHRSTA